MPPVLPIPFICLCHLVRLPGFDGRTTLQISLPSHLPVSKLALNDWSDSGDDVGTIVGGVIGGVVFLGAALLAVMWKTGRLENRKCGGRSGGCKPCCGPSEPAAAIATTGTHYPVRVSSAGAPPASAANLPTLPAPAYPTTTGAPSTFTAHVPATPPLPATATFVYKAPPTPDTTAAPPAYETPAKGWAKHSANDEEQSSPTPDGAAAPPAYETPAKHWAKHPTDDQD